MSFFLPLARQRALLRSSLSHCELLQGELKGITAPSFSAQATFIARQLSLLVEHVAGVLQAQHSKRHSGGRLERARKIDHLLRRVHLLARGLRQSHPSDCPPTAQFFVDSLLDHFLPHLKEQQSILVSATQTYRWGCLDVWRFLEESLDVSDLLAEGPQESAAPGDPPTLQELLGVMAGRPPPRCAILGLAQLDAPDPLLFPLLAHELGHLEAFHRDPAWTRALLAGRGESKRIQKFASFCAQELLCDLIASRMMGITYLCALHHFFSITEVEFCGSRAIVADPPAHAEDFYPSPSFRLRLILDRALSARDMTRESVFRELVEALDRDLPRMADFHRPSSGSDATAVEQVIRDILPRIEEIASEIIPPGKAADLPGHLPRLIRELRAGIPPLNIGVERATAQGINEVICAGWHLRLRGESDTNTNILVDKSIELSDLFKPGSDLEQEDLSAWRGSPVPSQRGVLSSSTLRSHLAHTDVDARGMTPEPRPEEGAGQGAPARPAPPRRRMDPHHADHLEKSGRPRQAPEPHPGGELRAAPGQLVQGGPPHEVPLREPRGEGGSTPRAARVALGVLRAEKRGFHPAPAGLRAGLLHRVHRAARQHHGPRRREVGPGQDGAQHRDGGPGRPGLPREPRPRALQRRHAPAQAAPWHGGGAARLPDHRSTCP